MKFLLLRLLGVVLLLSSSSLYAQKLHFRHHVGIGVTRISDHHFQAGIGPVLSYSPKFILNFKGASTSITFGTHLSASFPYILQNETTLLRNPVTVIESPINVDFNFGQNGAKTSALRKGYFIGVGIGLSSIRTFTAPALAFVNPTMTQGLYLQAGKLRRSPRTNHDHTIAFYTMIGRNSNVSNFGLRFSTEFSFVERLRKSLLTPSTP